MVSDLRVRLLYCVAYLGLGLVRIKDVDLGAATSHCAQGCHHTNGAGAHDHGLI